MRTLRLLLVPTIIATVLVASPADAVPSSYTAAMNAEEVKPLPGPPGAKGTATIVADQEAGTVCYKLTYEGGPMTAAHIHRGEKGLNGPVTIPLDIAKDCVNPDPAEIKALVDWPDGYYVEIHTIVYQQHGAARGQVYPVAGSPMPAHQQH